MTGQTSAMMALRDPDIRLMLRVRADDPAAFAELVERFQTRLVAVMNHLIGNAEEAEDLAQEVFLRVYRNRHKYTPLAKFSTWLFTIANNLALNSIRNKKTRQVVPLPDTEFAPQPGRSTEHYLAKETEPPTENLQQQELAQVIRRALDDLNERQRMAIVLNKFEDMNYQEIAEIMGLNVQGVKSLLSRARMKLRDALTPYIYMDQQEPAPSNATEAEDEES